MNESDQAMLMILRTLALVSLGAWAAATAIYGLFDLVNSVQNVHAFRTARESFGPDLFDVSILVSLGFFAGTAAGGVGVLLGAVHIGLAGRGVLTCAGFVALGLGGVIGAVVLEQHRVAATPFALSYLSWYVLGGLLLPLIALVVFIGSWVSVRDLTPAHPGPARSS